MFTKHAHLRCQQRAIPQLAVDLLLQFGTAQKAPGGVCKVFLDKAGRRRLHAYAGPLASLLNEHLDVYAIVDEKTESVITVGHRLERIRKH
jgi:hypothetical protein